jgi:hypothetical protein
VAHHALRRVMCHQQRSLQIRMSSRHGWKHRAWKARVGPHVKWRHVRPHVRLLPLKVASIRKMKRVKVAETTRRARSSELAL